jgi:internalin A
MNRTTSLFFYVYDDVTPGSELVVTAVSGNTNLVPDAGIALQHDYDTTWTLAVTPLAGQTGTSTITITATDDTGFTTTTDLTVTVFYAPIVAIPDPILEAAVRSALGSPTGPLTTFDLESLTSLSSSWNGTITNLAGLEWATNLTSLYLPVNAITSLSPLLALSQLQTLDIDYNNLGNLAPLQGLTNLTTLTLDGNMLTDLSFLASLPNLITLSAASCSLSNLAGIGALAHLQSVSLGYNGLRDPSPLASLTNLTYLDLQGNPLAGTTGLVGPSTLVSLNLTRCSLNDLGGFRGLTNLQSLALASNAIRDLSPLAGLTNLAYLALDSNPITSVAALGDLPRLTTLSLMNCHLANLASLHGFTALKSLGLANNGIRDLTPLAGLVNLSTLYLSGNWLTNLAPLSVLPVLTTLDVASCSLSNLGSLAGLTHLRSLSLAYDSAIDISSLTNLTSLYSLYLTANRLTNLNGLQNLSGLSSVDLTRNLLDLSAGSLTLTTITNLQDQGVWVNYVPQNEPPMFYIPRTNWVIRPNAAADLPLSVIDDVTLPDKVSVTVTCSSAGPLSNSVITLVRTSFYIPPLPTAPILLPPMPIQPPRPGPTPLDASPGPPFGIVPYGGGVSYWNLAVTPPLNQTGTMTLTLTATDDTGLSTNTTILVTVSPPQALDGSWLGATNLVWQTSGNAPWFGQTNISHGGISAAQSGLVGANEESWLETTVTGPGILTFWWKMTATNYGIYVAFTTSRGGELYLEGNTGWRRAMVSIPAGECVLDWRFASTWGADPSDACWLDQVSFVPTTPDFWVELWTGSGSTLAELTIHGEPGGLYELQVSTNLLDWTPLSRVVLDLANGGFTSMVNDPATQGSARFYRARELPASVIWFAPVAFDAGGSPVLQLYCQPGTACEIQASTDLLTWSALATVTNTTGTVTFTDSQKGLAERFYRARQLP